MRATDISNALAERLATGAGLPTVVWENQDTMPPNLPYLVFDNVRTGSRDAALSGGARVDEGYLMITVVAAQNQFATPATNIADDVAERFAYGLRLAFDGGHVLITRPPTVMRGYPDEADFRVPVRIDYQAFGLGPFSNTPIPTPGDSNAPFQYVQASPSLTWTVNHNLGWNPQVTILTLGGVEIEAAINHTSVNQFVVTFAVVQSGYAIYE